MGFLNYFRFYYLGLRLGYIYLLTNWVVAMLIPFIFSPFPQTPERIWKNYLPKMLLSAALMECVAAVLYLLLGDPSSSHCIGGFLLLLLFASRSGERPVQEQIALGYGFAGTFPNIISFLTTIGMINEEENQVLQAILSLATIVLLVAVVQLFRRVTQEGVEDDWILIPIGVLGTLGAFFGLGAYWLKIDNVIKLPIYVLAAMLEIGIYAMMFYMGAWLRRRQNAHAEEILRQADENMLNVLKNNLASYRKLRHDMENHFNLMKSLLEHGEYDKLRDYFDQYAGHFVPTFSAINCGNNTVTVILNMELEKAKQAGLTLEASAIVPETLNISDTDLCSLLTNLIDNAIEYLSAHPELENHTVSVSLRLVRENLLVSVKNAIRPEDEARALTLKTGKADAAHHGLGTKIAAAVAAHYNGVLRCQVENGEFVADAMLTQPL